MLTILWLEEESKWDTDLLQEEWFTEEGSALVTHDGIGLHRRVYKARCNVKVAGSVVDLDYAPHRDFNEHDGIFLGVMRIQFDDHNRVAIKEILWKELGDDHFVPCSTIVGFQKQDHGFNSHWTDDEFEAAVRAYLWMLAQEQNGKAYKKSDMNEALRNGPLSARTKASIEYRMQNISAVLEELSLPWLKGYIPAKNVGETGKEKIKEFLAKHQVYAPEDYAPTDDPDVLDEKVRKIRKKIDLSAPPAGQKTPKQSTGTSTGYARDPVVKAWVLENAKGICEGCGKPAPFMRSTGEPFLEHHHLKELGEQGSDTITNSIAACPNCHRRCHHSSDRVIFIDSIYLKVSRLVRE